MDPGLISYNVFKDDAMFFEFQEGYEPILHGDVHFTFKHKGVMYDTQFCRIAMNTAFINPQNSIIISKYNVSPDSI